MARIFQRSPLSIAILALLYEAPMHPYRIQQLIKERGQEKIINVERTTSLYQTVGQLEKAGLIRVQKTMRMENRPDRTVYELTEKGRTTLRDWLYEALATPAHEFPEFPAAVSYLGLLSQEEALHQLEVRETTLGSRLVEIDSVLRAAQERLPRLFLIEEEYRRAVLEAELNWLRSLIADLREMRLTWNEEWLRRFMVSPTEDE